MSPGEVSPALSNLIDIRSACAQPCCQAVESLASRIGRGLAGGAARPECVDAQATRSRTRLESAHPKPVPRREGQGYVGRGVGLCLVLARHPFEIRGEPFGVPAFADSSSRPRVPAQRQWPRPTLRSSFYSRPCRRPLARPRRSPTIRNRPC